MSYKKLFITSLPRSGSTVLTTMLDQYADILCLPESFFPAAVEQVNADEWCDTRRMAALFLVSCSDGSPLSLDEAEACMLPDKEATLDAIASAVATKSGRDSSGIRIVVWKFTRLVGCWRYANSTDGQFLILRRNPLNVYQSQFRVHFGQKNKNPARFALFEASYLVAFKEYPASKTLHLEYSEIDKRLAEIAQWMGSKGEKRADGTSGIGELSGRNAWHSDINKPFQNRDLEKLTNLKSWQKFTYLVSGVVLKWAPYLPQLARKFADKRQNEALHQQADLLLKTQS